MQIRNWSTGISHEIQSRIAADAGLEKAIVLMNRKLRSGPWDGKYLPYSIHEELPNSEGVFSYKVTAAPGGEYVITSVGTCGRSNRTVRASLGLKSLWEYAILTKEQITLKSNTLVSGYNSSDPTDTDIALEMATISTEDSRIILNSNVTVEGDVLVGPGGDTDQVIKDLGATVDNTLQMPMIPPFPQVEPSPLIDKNTGLKVKDSVVTIGPADSGRYSDINISGKTTALQIDGGDVVLHIKGDINLGTDTGIVVKPGSSLTLFVDGDIISGNGSGIDYEGSPKVPTHIQIYATGTGVQTLELKAKSNWSGVVYAPNSNVEVKAKGDLYGSIVAESFDFKYGGNFYYDEALREVSIDDIGVRFVVNRWAETSEYFTDNWVQPIHRDYSQGIEGTPYIDLNEDDGLLRDPLLPKQ
jgi:hypothetical protein